MFSRGITSTRHGPLAVAWNQAFSSLVFALGMAIHAYQIPVVATGKRNTRGNTIHLKCDTGMAPGGEIGNDPGISAESSLASRQSTERGHLQPKRQPRAPYVCSVCGEAHVCGSNSLDKPGIYSGYVKQIRACTN
jgi:hypothetical protein